jgi:phosphomethylpyrimidine synthase
MIAPENTHPEHSSEQPAIPAQAGPGTEQYHTHSLAWLEDAEHGIHVPVTEIALEPSGEHPNPPVQVYRTMGPGSVPEQGLPPQREPWIIAREDTETYAAPVSARRLIRALDTGADAQRR